MQTRLRLAWRAGPAILVTSAAFALLHMEWIHAAMAFVLGIYLGALTERTGSALPAIVCHVVNNSVFTVVTALTGTVDDRPDERDPARCGRWSCSSRAVDSCCVVCRA